jgi:hypothetical protein
MNAPSRAFAAPPGPVTACAHHREAGVPHHCRARFGAHRTGAGIDDDLGRGYIRAVLELDIEPVVEPDHLSWLQPSRLRRGRSLGPGRRYAGHSDPVTGQPDHAHRAIIEPPICPLGSLALAAHHAPV